MKRLVIEERLRMMLAGRKSRLMPRHMLPRRRLLERRAYSKCTARLKPKRETSVMRMLG